MAETLSTIDVAINNLVPPNMLPQYNAVKEKTNNSDRRNEKSLVSSDSKASVTVRNNGQINLSASKYANVNVNPSGDIIENSFSHTVNTNRFYANTNEVVINKHKMNHLLWDLSDFKTVSHINNSCIGDLCISGTVLVKAWDYMLKKYVLIRRPINTPMFFQQLNVPAFPSGMKVNDNTAVDVSDLNSFGKELTLKEYQEIAKKTESLNINYKALNEFTKLSDIAKCNEAIDKYEKELKETLQKNYDSIEIKTDNIKSKYESNLASIDTKIKEYKEAAKDYYDKKQEAEKVVNG